METLRVLVVDDEPGMRTGAARVLERFVLRLPETGGEVRFEVDQTDTGEEALEKIEASRPDIVLLDHKLAGELSGLDVLQRLAERRSNSLVVMITAYATLETAVSATKKGSFDFLAKPFTPDELRATIHKAAKHVALQRQARRHAEEKRRLRFEFISVLAHELKAPIAAVEGYLRLLEDKSLGDSVSAYEQMVSRSLTRLEGMRRLINDLLDATRLESGQKKRELESIDVRDACRSAAETVAPDAAQKQIEVALHAPEPVPMVADRGEIELLLTNLLTNAVKYNRPGGRVDVRARAENGQVTVTVQDTGIGMTEEEMGRLFKDFGRIKNEKTRNIPGTGLGLSTVKKVALLYGGDVSVASTPDVGSTFTLTLPQEPEQTAPGV
jgi:two-component system sensor histidine kinase/response regulator